jgi:hypothetical protein
MDGGWKRTFEALFELGAMSDLRPVGIGRCTSVPQLYVSPRAGGCPGKIFTWRGRFLISPRKRGEVNPLLHFCEQNNRANISEFQHWVSARSSIPPSVCCESYFFPG